MIKNWLMKKIAIVFVLIFTISCTKYEDGPLFTFRSKTTRIAHTWIYDAIIYTEQGITVTTGLPAKEMTFSKDGTYTENTGFKGTWKFKGEIELEIKKTKNDTTVQEIWEITRLSNKQLWLRKNKVDHHFKVK